MSATGHDFQRAVHHLQPGRCADAITLSLDIQTPSFQIEEAFLRILIVLHVDPVLTGIHRQRPVPDPDTVVDIQPVAGALHQIGTPGDLQIVLANDPMALRGHHRQRPGAVERQVLP